MKRKKATLLELEERECIAKFAPQCSGIRMSGLHGYVCESCIDFSVKKLENEEISEPSKVCSYCGSDSPTYGNDLCGFCCSRCYKNAAKTAEETRKLYNNN